MSKYGKVKVSTKKPWEVGRGHHAHRSGSGTHDSRPRRLRTRMDAKKKALQDFD